jgi:predicted RNase H-like HicB family nuclease
MKYLVIVEKGPSSYGASVPDLPGCIAVGETEKEVIELIQEAIQFHLEDLQSEGQPIPPSVSQSTFIEVGLAA